MVWEVSNDTTREEDFLEEMADKRITTIINGEEYEFEDEDELKDELVNIANDNNWSNSVVEDVNTDEVVDLEDVQIGGNYRIRPASTEINGVKYDLESVAELIDTIKRIARENGYKKFDVKDLDTGRFVDAEEIQVGNRYELIPYNVPK